MYKLMIFRNKSIFYEKGVNWIIIKYDIMDFGYAGYIMSFFINIVL